jgi:hypothetical protein
MDEILCPKCKSNWHEYVTLYGTAIVFSDSDSIWYKKCICGVVYDIKHNSIKLKMDEIKDIIAKREGITDWSYLWK